MFPLLTIFLGWSFSTFLQKRVWGGELTKIIPRSPVIFVSDFVNFVSDCPIFVSSNFVSDFSNFVSNRANFVSCTRAL